MQISGNLSIEKLLFRATTPRLDRLTHILVDEKISKKVQDITVSSIYLLSKNERTLPPLTEIDKQIIKIKKILSSKTFFFKKPKVNGVEREVLNETLKGLKSQFYILSHVTNINKLKQRCKNSFAEAMMKFN
jgi:hypothetical protein